MVCVFLRREGCSLSSGKRRWLITSEEATSYAPGTLAHLCPGVSSRCDQTPCSCSSELCLSYRPVGLQGSLLCLGDP